MDIKSWLYGLLRGAAQGLWTSAIVYLGQHGIVLPDPVANALQGWFVDIVVVGGVFGLFTGFVQWLESRKGEGFWPTKARQLAKVIMLGLSRQAVYAVTDNRATTVAVTAANGARAETLRE